MKRALLTVQPISAALLVLPIKGLKPLGPASGVSLHNHVLLPAFPSCVHAIKDGVWLCQNGQDMFLQTS